ncbi:MAG: DUF4157 domain-containing protein, partial [Acidobacteriota bacterium]|nr:DUF4157 domain-containing protein [Acidobacteriota bacterium]
FGRSLADARLHTDGAAARLASSFSARAFTVGNDIAFGAGQYRPGTLEGDLLIAHELAHTTQPAHVPEREAERAADHSAAAALGLTRSGPRAGGSSGGLKLRRCTDPLANAPPEVRLAARIMHSYDLEALTAPSDFNASAVLEEFRRTDQSVITGALQIMRLRTASGHVSYYDWFIRRMQHDLGANDWAEFQRRIGIDPLSGRESIDLTDRGRALLTLLRSMQPTPGTAGPVLSALRSTPVEEVNAVLTVLHRTADEEYGNAMFRLSALMQRAGTTEQYRDFIRFLHESGLTTALDEADPRLGVLTEQETALNRTGRDSAMSDEDMAGLFAARAREIAYVMLRDSERQLVTALTRSQGGGGEGSSLDADADTATSVLNRHFNPDVRLITFEQFSSRARPQLIRQGLTPTDDQLRTLYNRQRQITLYRLGAARERLVVAQLADVRRQISEHRDWFREVHVIHGNVFAGPALELRERQRLQEEADRRNAALRRLESRREALETVQRDVERVLPLLGGLDDAALQRMAELPGGVAQFDEIVNRRLGEIFGNIEQARRMLHSGDVNVWLLPPVVAATRRALGIADPPQNDTQRRWVRVIEAQVASARADEERTRRVLEILNVGALIAAIGAALFTGGGSLALYVGIAGTGIGLASSVYDVVEASRRTAQAETLYGTGATEGMRLSDVPPDYRFLHMAWIGLGVNVVLSAFFLRSVGPELVASLRGEEAVVRLRAQEIVRRLRAAGATQAEEELLAATMQALRDRGWVTGGVRGASIYDAHPTRREWISGAGRSLEAGVDNMAANPRIHG